MKRRVLGLLLLAVFLTGCVGSGQKELAKELSREITLSIGDVLAAETKLAGAIDRRDAATVEAGVLKVDDIKRQWKRQTSPATGKVADAANLYTRALEARAKEFEAASRTALYRKVEDSRALVRFQEEAMDLEEEASSKLEVLAK